MKAWVHRDAKGKVLAVVATDNPGHGTLSLEGATDVGEIDCTGFDDPRDIDQLQKIMSMHETARRSD